MFLCFQGEKGEKKGKKPSCRKPSQSSSIPFGCSQTATNTAESLSCCSSCPLLPGKEEIHSWEELEGEESRFGSAWPREGGMLSSHLGWVLSKPLLLWGLHGVSSPTQFIFNPHRELRQRWISPCKDPAQRKGLGWSCFGHFLEGKHLQQRNHPLCAHNKYSPETSWGDFI